MGFGRALVQHASDARHKDLLLTCLLTTDHFATYLQYAFAARLEDGGVVAWGDANNGGLIPPAKVSESVYSVPQCWVGWGQHRGAV